MLEWWQAYRALNLGASCTKTSALKHEHQPTILAACNLQPCRAPMDDCPCTQAAECSGTAHAVPPLVLQWPYPGTRQPRWRERYSCPSATARGPDNVRICCLHHGKRWHMSPDVCLLRMPAALLSPGRGRCCSSCTDAATSHSRSQCDCALLDKDSSFCCAPSSSCTYACTQLLPRCLPLYVPPTVRASLPLYVPPTVRMHTAVAQVPPTVAQVPQS